MRLLSSALSKATWRRRARTCLISEIGLTSLNSQSTCRNFPFSTISRSSARSRFACLRCTSSVFSPEAIRLPLGAHSTPSGHPAHQHPATYSTLIRPGSRSAATQVCIVSLKSLSPSISLRVCASIRPSVRSDKRCAPAGRGSHRPRSDRRSVRAICPPASG